jgi:HAD superfamily hydrolase (TIGR01484 family)
MPKKFEKDHFFPKPKDRTILIDLDNTLIDKNYALTDQSVIPALANLQLRGYQVGLSSDSGLTTLTDWSKKLMLNGPIIAERGAIVRTSTGNIRYVNPAFEETKQNGETEFKSAGFDVWKGDAPDAIRTNMQIGTPGGNLVLINELRKFSIGMYARQVGADGQLIIREDLTQEMYERMRPLFPAFNDLVVDLNHDYGILILSRESTNKREGTRFLMAMNGLDQIGMIGDSITDFLGKDIARHYAVKNAKPQFKAVSDYVSQFDFASGVIDIASKL